MGTRGIVGVVVDSTEKISYNHWDSYPSGLGVCVLAEAGDIAKDLSAARVQARNMKLVDEDSRPTDAEIENLKPFWDARVSTGQATEWYALMRDLQGKLSRMLEVGYMINADSFPIDSLFCEWGYLIDLDREVLQVYKGFQTERHNEGRWAGLPDDKAIAERRANAKKRYDKGELNFDQFQYFAKTEYHSIKLVAEWPLAELPTEEDFLKALEPAEEDE